MKAINKIFRNRAVRVLPAVALVLLAGTLSAHADVAGGLTKASTELTKYLPLVQKIIYAVAGLVFIIGGFSVYVKMSNGEQDVKSSIMMYVGGVLFLLIVGSIAPTLFV